MSEENEKIIQIECVRKWKEEGDGDYVIFYALTNKGNFWRRRDREWTKIELPDFDSE